jgi:hypothetical protein
MKPTTLYLVPIVGLVIAFALHLPVRRKWRIPVVRSGYAVLLIGALTLFHAQPAVIREVNAITGVANFSAPLVYALNTSFSGAIVALMINWRGGEPDRIRRAWQLCLSIYTACAAAVIILFALGDAPVERLTDFDSYYATTPFIREMIVLYLAAHTVAVATLMRLCQAWQREVDGALRTGLWLILMGGWFDFGFQFSKYISVVARWTGHDLDFFSTSIAPVMVSIAAFLVAAGFTLPRVSRPIAAQRKARDQYRQLAPLWSTLSHVGVPIQPLVTWRQSPEYRLRLRQIAIHDALLRLNPHFDQRVHAGARASAVANGQPAAGADLTAEAAVIAAAVESSAADAPPCNPDGAYKLTSAHGSVGTLVELSRALPQLPAVARRAYGAPPNTA